MLVVFLPLHTYIYIYIYNIYNRIYSKERLVPSLPFDLKYLMRASLEWRPSFLSKGALIRELVFKGGAHLRITLKKFYNTANLVCSGIFLLQIVVVYTLFWTWDFFFCYYYCSYCLVKEKSLVNEYFNVFWYI